MKTETNAFAATSAYLAALFFVAALAVTLGFPSTTGVLATTTWFAAILWVAFYVCVLPVIGALPAPAWAKGAAYGWIVVDIALNVASLNPINLASSDYQALETAVRLGIHVSASVWIAMVAYEGTSAMRTIGWPTAVALGGYSLLNPYLPASAFYPGVVLLIGWFVVAGLHLSRPTGRTVAGRRAPSGRSRARTV